MKTTFTFSLLVLFVASSFAQANKQDQIDMAVLAAPEAVRAGATVYGFADDGEMITLRKGTNDFIVRSDDPNKSGFEVVCYGVDAEEFMARGRALRAEGLNFGEVLAQREKDAEAGELKMPNTGSILHIYAGKEASYNPATKTIENAFYRYVVYMPGATTENSGYPTKPNGEGGHPWLMYPGTYRAHIMISPVKVPKKDN
jgi:hypothetical protein